MGQKPYFIPKHFLSIIGCFNLAYLPLSCQNNSKDFVSVFLMK